MAQFNRSMTILVAEIVRLVPEFHAIRHQGILVSATFQKSRSRAGLLAYVLPLKYREGSPVEARVRGRKVYHWVMLPYRHEGNEILYIIYFMLPRFLALGWKEKLETVVHELYHINPTFNGDLRRFPGRSRLHGRMEDYDRKVRELTHALLSVPLAPHFYDFLRAPPPLSVEAHHIPEPRPRLLKVATLSDSRTR